MKKGKDVIKQIMMQNNSNEAKICIIVGAGQVDSGFFSWLTEQLETSGIQLEFIAVDGGYTFLKKQHIMPFLAVGDFDSLGYIPEQVRTVFHAPEKDKTDMLLAVDECRAAGFGRVCIFGGVGGRFDHTYANVQTLAYAKEQNLEAALLDQSMCAFLIKESFQIIKEGIFIEQQLFFPEGVKNVLASKKYLSVFSFDTTAEQVSIAGCKYPLKDAEVTSVYPIGVSNEISKDAEKVEITVEKGRLLIMLCSE